MAAVRRSAVSNRPVWPKVARVITTSVMPPIAPAVSACSRAASGRLGRNVLRPRPQPSSQKERAEALARQGRPVERPIARYPGRLRAHSASVPVGPVLPARRASRAGCRPRYDGSSSCMKQGGEA
jgi:hypothetical protein